MNIIVLTIDTLRYDYIGADGNDWIKTPNMDELFANSWVFDRSFTGSFPGPANTWPAARVSSSCG